jgi:16S rRNA processing protein RimM
MRLARSSELELGEVMAPFGFKGELKIFLYNPAGRWSGPREVVLRDTSGARHAVRLSLRPGAGKRILGTIEGLHDVADVERFVGAKLLAEREALPAQEYYEADLLGLPVRTVGGKALGVLTAIHPQGDVDLWEVEGDPVLYVPAREGMIVRVEPGVAITVADEAEGHDAI